MRRPRKGFRLLSCRDPSGRSSVDDRGQVGNHKHRSKGEGMSGDWIKMRVDLADDPAVIAIAAATKLCADTVVGKLCRLWAWADRHTCDGAIVGVGAQWIDSFLQKRGFTAAMVTAGWLETTTNGVRFPHFDRHNGESAKVRALAKNRKQVQRSSRDDSHPVPKESRNERDNSVTDSGQNADKPVTREEKRREDQKQKQKRATLVALPPDFGISDRVRAWAEEKGHTRLAERLEHFIGKAKAKGYTYVDWDEGFMGAIRDDWAELNDAPGSRSTAQPSKRVAL